MTTNPVSKKSNRSWTARPEEPRNRIGAMVFLGLSVLGLTSVFVWYYLLRPGSPRSYVATLSIEDYGIDIPKIRLGKWDANAMAKVDGIFPWKEIAGLANPQNQRDIERFISDYQGFPDLKPTQDTAVVQMRCHAAVTDQGDQGWSCGLYINDDPLNNKPYPFQEFLEQIKSIPAKNIIIFAEIADLQYEPHLGWVVNPIERYIRKACKEADWKGMQAGKQVWIVCSQADFQSPFYSVKRSKTLFQEACEQSIQSEAAREDRGTSLSLGRYFKLVYRYCHTASAGLQTPRLILASQSDDELPSAKDVFLLAYQNRTVLTKSNSESKDKNKGKASPDASSDSPPHEAPPKEDSAKNADYSRKKRSVPVSFRQSDASPQSPEQADGIAKPGQGSATTKTVEQDPWLRIWQLRDEIESRGAKNQSGESQGNNEGDKSEGTRWSPRDFAPLAWRKLQADLALASIWAPPIGKEDPSANKSIVDQIKALELLSKSLETGNVATIDRDSQGLHWDVLKAWKEFRSDDKNHRQKWQNDTTSIVDSSTGLVGGEVDVWKRQRSEYRRYVDCLSDLSLWMDLSANLSSAKIDNSKIQDKCNELLESLLSQKQHLPSDASQSAQERSTSLRLDEAIALKTSLQELLSDAIRSNKLDGNKGELTWIQERQYQVLLSSPLLTYQQRVQLVRTLKDRKVKTVVPETNQEFKTIQRPNTIVQVETLGRRCEQLKEAWKLLSEQPFTKIDSNDLDKWLEWGVEYRNGVADLFSSSLSSATEDLAKDPAVWHYQSLVEPKFATKLSSDKLPLAKSYAGIVVSPISGKTIRLVRNTELLNFEDGKSSLPVGVTVKHFDGTEVPHCKLTWTTGPDLKELKVTYNAKSIPQGQAFSTQPKNMLIELQCSLPDNMTPPSGSFIKIIVGESNNENAFASLTVPVFRNADKIDLIARRTSTGEQLKLKMKKEDSDGPESFVELESPAIQGAKSQFSFALSNNQSKPRRAEVKVFAIPSLNTLLSPEPSNLISKFWVDLPAMQESQLKLKLLAPEQLLNQLDKDDALQAMLLFEITEYEYEVPDPERKREPKKLEKAPWRHWARFKPTKPGEPTLRTNTSKLESENRWKIDFTAMPQLWAYYDLKDLKIDVQQQILRGKDVVTKPTTPLVLNSVTPTRQFPTPVIEQETQRFLMNIGGYPRAMVLNATPGSQKLEAWFDDQVKIVDFRLVPDEPEKGGINSQPDPKEKGEPEDSKVEGPIVVPKYLNGKMILVECDTIVDRDPNSSISYAIFKVDGKSKEPILGPYELSSDRSFIPKLALREDGSLTVAFEPGELKIRMKLDGQDLEGEYEFRINVGEQQAVQKIVFDKTKPETGFVDADGTEPILGVSREDKPKKVRTLFQGEKIEVWIEAKDSAGLGIASAEFAIGSFDGPKPIITEGIPSGTGRFKMILDASSLEKRPSGDFLIVAKTVDWAGNIQANNYPLKIIWMGTERPAVPK